MIKNPVKATLSKENEDAVVQKINEISGMLPFVQGLTAEERKALPKMGKKSVDFVERTIQYASDHKELNPSYFSLESVQQDFTLLKQMERIMGLLGPLTEKVKATQMMLGTQSFTPTRAFYKYVKLAAKEGVPGSIAIGKDLADRYKKKASKETPTPQDASKTVTVK